MPLALNQRHMLSGTPLCGTPKSMARFASGLHPSEVVFSRRHHCLRDMVRSALSSSCYLNRMQNSIQDKEQQCQRMVMLRYPRS